MAVMFKLFRCDRCFGDKKKRETVNKVFLMSHKKMDRLIRIVNASTDGEKFTYYIEKYVYDIQKIRKISYLHQITEDGLNCKWELSTTWEKYVYDLKDKIWRSSDYRYDDEIVNRTLKDDENAFDYI